MTDHRIKLTAHNLDEILAGNLDEFTEALAAEEKRARLEAQTATDVRRQPTRRLRRANVAVGDA